MTDDTIRAPQILVTLSPQGELVIELPGANGLRRQVVPGFNRFEATALRILRAQQDGDMTIGLDGAPTRQQVKHWERHEEWPDARCPFCIREGRIKGHDPLVDRQKQRRKARELIASGEVQIRRVKEGASGLAPKGAKVPSGKTSEEMGL